MADSALTAPQASLGGVEFYPAFEQKVAILLEHLIKNHPLPNGNKRAADAAMWRFVVINNRKWTLEDPNELVSMMVRVATGEVSTEELVAWVAQHIEE